MVIQLAKSACCAAALQADMVPFDIAAFRGADPGRQDTAGAITRDCAIKDVVMDKYKTR